MSVLLHNFNLGQHYVGCTDQSHLSLRLEPCNIHMNRTVFCSPKHKFVSGWMGFVQYWRSDIIFTIIYLLDITEWNFVNYPIIMYLDKLCFTEVFFLPGRWLKWWCIFLTLMAYCNGWYLQKGYWIWGLIHGNGLVLPLCNNFVITKITLLNMWPENLDGQTRDSILHLAHWGRVARSVEYGWGFA